MGSFDKLKSEGMEISEILRICLKCNTKEEAAEVLKEYEEQYSNPELAHANLGYIFGYADDEGRKKLYSLFPLNHPIFGPTFGRGGDSNVNKVLTDIIRERTEKSGGGQNV